MNRMSRAATGLSAAVAAASLLALGCAHVDDEVVFPRRHAAEAPPPPRRPCPALPPDSPLRPLQSQQALGGCPGDVALRPGTYLEAEVSFTCPASSDPLIILHGKGRTRFPALTDPGGRRRLHDELGEAAHGLAWSADAYGPDGAPAPPCTTSARGLIVALSDYDDIDTVVDGLRRWFHANDLDVELVIRLALPPPGKAPLRAL